MRLPRRRPSWSAKVEVTDKKTTPSTRTLEKRRVVAGYTDGAAESRRLESIIIINSHLAVVTPLL
jgi:nicotinate-nucleotide pyrophosphorylase